MIVRLTLRHLGAHRGSMWLLLLAVGLVAGFCALQPLVHDRLADASARAILDDLSEEMANIALYNPQPIDLDLMPGLAGMLGEVYPGVTRFSRANGFPDMPTLGKICGFDYAEGELLTSTSRYAFFTSDHCYVVYSFGAPEDLFRLESGDWPDVREPSPDLSGTDSRLMGEPQLEAVITSAIAQQTGIRVGDRLVVGDRFDRALIVEIVGLVAPALDPQDVFWHGNNIALTGEWTLYGDDMRFDIGLIVPEAAFAQWMSPIAFSQDYVWWLDVDPGTISAAQLRALDHDLYEAARQVRLTHPEIALVSGLTEATAQYQADLAGFQDSVRGVAVALLVLLVAQAVAVGGRFFGVRRSLWTLLHSRGAGRRQIAGAMLLAAGLIAGIGGLLGVLIGWALLAAFGPETLPGSDGIDGAALGYSLAGAGVVLAVLTLPAWRTAGRSRQTRRPPVSFPPPKPLWARYYLDAALLLGGVALIVRLYLLAGGSLEQSLRDLVQDPAALKRRIGADETPGEGGLNDPFNLAGPVLIAAGGVLLWLRLLPDLLRLPARLAAGRRSLLLPLVLWRSRHLPDRIAGLALTLAGAAAVGAASLALNATQDAAAWHAARHEVGGDARLAFDAADLPADRDWTTLPGVTASAVVMRLESTQPFVSVYGVDPLALRAAFPEVDPALAALAGPVEGLPGWRLADGTTALALQVFSEPNPDDPGEIGLDVVLLDARGRTVAAPMTANGDATGQWVTFRADLAALDGQRPWRLLGVRLASTHADTHTVYLDDVVAHDGTGTVTLLEDFEAAALAGWTGAPDQPSNILTPARSTDRAAGGAASLRVDYLVRFSRYADLHPVLLVAGIQTPTLPVIASESLVDQQSQRSHTAPRMQVGDTGLLRLQLPLGTFSLSYRVVGIVPDLPTAAGESFLVAALEPLRLVLNAVTARVDYYDRNQVWLELDGRVPGADLRGALAGSPGVTGAVFAWDRYEDIRRAPAQSAVAGIVQLGFGTAALLAWLHLLAAVAAVDGPRAHELAVLEVLGWSRRRRRDLLAAELAVGLLPSLAVGMALGVLLDYLLLPFVALPGDETLRLPLLALAGLGLLGAAVVGATALIAARRWAERAGGINRG